MHSSLAQQPPVPTAGELGYLRSSSEVLQVQAGQAEHLPKPWQEKALSQML